MQPSAGPRSPLASGALLSAQQWRIACTAWNCFRFLQIAVSSGSCVGCCWTDWHTAAHKALSRGRVCRGW